MSFFCIIARLTEKRQRAHLCLFVYSFKLVSIGVSAIFPYRAVHCLQLFGVVRYTDRSLPDVMRFFKTMTTNEYIRGVKDGTLTPFDGKLWQKSYYDHVIRNQQDYNEIWQYIESNPAKWIMMHERP